jgi:hypothetical protein
MIYVSGTLDSGDTAWVTFTTCPDCSNFLTLMDDCLRSGKLAKILGDQGFHVYASTADGAGTLATLTENTDGDDAHDYTAAITFGTTSTSGLLSCALVDP